MRFLGGPRRLSPTAGAPAPDLGVRLNLRHPLGADALAFYIFNEAAAGFGSAARMRLNDLAGNQDALVAAGGTSTWVGTEPASPNGGRAGVKFAGGANDYAQIAFVNAHNRPAVNGGFLTIGCIFRYNVTNAGSFMPLVARWDDLTAGGNNRIWALTIDASGGGGGIFRVDSSPDGTFYAGNKVSGPNAVTGTIYHATVTFGPKSTRFYLNGVLQASIAPSNPGFFNSVIPNLQIAGAIFGNVFKTSQVTMLHVYVHSTAWTADQVAQKHAASFAMVEDMSLGANRLPVVARRPELLIEWKAALAQNRLLPIEWLSHGRRATLPIEFLRTLAFARLLPVEWLGFISLDRSPTLPVEFRAALRLARRLPFESVGGDPNSLSLIWDVIRLLDQPLLFSWDVLKFAAQFPLEMQWTILEAIAGLELRWNDVPDIFTPFGITPLGQLTSGVTDGDVQKPTAEIIKTP